MKAGTLVRYLKGTPQDGEVYWVMDYPAPEGFIALSEDGENYHHCGSPFSLEVIMEVQQ
jgi:hypothetical protein